MLAITFIVTCVFNIINWLIALFATKLPFLYKSPHRRRLGFVSANLILQAVFFYFFSNVLQQQAIAPAFAATVLITFITLWITKFCPICGRIMIGLGDHKLCKQCISSTESGKKISSFQLRLMGLAMLIIGIVMLLVKPDHFISRYNGTVSGLLVGGLYFLIHG